MALWEREGNGYWEKLWLCKKTKIMNENFLKMLLDRFTCLPSNNAGSGQKSMLSLVKCCYLMSNIVTK